MRLADGGRRTTVAASVAPLPPRRPPWVLVGTLAVVVAGVAGALATRALSTAGIEVAYVAPATPPPGPLVRVPAEVGPSVPGYVSSLRGLTEGAVSLTANGEPVPIDAGGGFGLYLPSEWTEVRLVAVGATGARTETVVTITATPTPADHPVTSAVHVAAGDWADPVVHQQVLDLIATGRINAVQLDVKDEAGVVGYASAVPLATTVGAATTLYDARQAVDELHDLGVRVIARIVNFLDPTLARWALANGRTDLIVLDPGGAPLANDYGDAAFTNFASPEVRQYQIDLAREAVGLGFDEILYDYVRRPEGDVTTMQFPGLVGPPEVSIARFVAETRAQVPGVVLGVSVFGISASRPEPTAQDMALLGPNVDYVAPMVYPSLWGSGEYGVADPPSQPAAIVGASLADFQRVLAGSGAAIVPWLQDFDSGSTVYGPAEVQAQIDAARAVGAFGFLLWNANSSYTPDGIVPPP